jgi:hypothetical protein
MTDEKKNETQQELFEQFSTVPKKPERFPSITKTQKPILLSTTLEQLLMVSIVGILVLCGVFFLGVLRGKSLTQPILSVPAAPVRPASVTLPSPPPVARPIAPVAVPARPPATPGAPVVSAAERPYTIQVVTHRKKEYAESEMAKIRKMGYVSIIIPSGEYFQVCAGQYATKDEAKKDLAFFSSRYKDCFLRHR